MVSLTLTNPRLIRNIWSGCDTVPRRKPSIARHNQNLEQDNNFLYFYFFASLNSMLNIAEKSRTTKYMLPLLLLLIDYKLILNIQTSSVYTTWHDTDSNSYTTLDCTTQGQF